MGPRIDRVPPGGGGGGGPPPGADGAGPAPGADGPPISSSSGAEDGVLPPVPADVSESARAPRPGTLSSFLSGVGPDLRRRLDGEPGADRAGEDGGGGPIRVVLGNEAGDADSIVSSLAMAYVLGLSDRGGGDGGKGGGDDGGGRGGGIAVPVVSVPRDDMALRRETSLLLEACGIDAGGLVYVDDPTAKVILGTDGSGEGGGGAHRRDLEVVLVDHNRIRSSLSHLSDSVVEIVDHHEDEGYHPRVTGARRCVAFDAVTKEAEAGSACTLVAERLLESLDDGERADPGLSLALLGVVLLDTMDMSPEAGKGTERDGEAIDALLARTDWLRLHPPIASRGRDVRDLFDGAGVPVRSALHDYLRNSKFDPEFWGEMSARDCLRIDYKRFHPPGDGGGEDFGMSSVLLPMDEFLRKPDLGGSIRRFMEADVPLLGVLTLHLVGGEAVREMVLAGRADLVRDVGDFLLKDEAAAFLGASEAGDDPSTRRLSEELSARAEEEEEMTARRFRQGNAKGSRKQVAPILLGVMSSARCR